MRRIGWWLPSFRWRVVADVADADQVPERLPRRGVVLVGLGGSLKWAAFDCPCGAERILLNLHHGRRPAWSITGNSLNGITIHPSVDTRHDGRRCHYFIRHGRIRWVHRTKEGRA